MQNVWGLTLEGAGLLAPGNPDMDSNTGDGVRMLREIGAELCMQQAVCMNDSINVGGISDWGMSEILGKDVNIHDSSNIDAILVDKTGRRFARTMPSGAMSCTSARKLHGSRVSPRTIRLRVISSMCTMRRGRLFRVKGHIARHVRYYVLGRFG